MTAKDEPTGADSLCLSDLRLDQVLARELEPAALAEAEGHLAGCPPCVARRAEREQERQLFRDTAPPLFSGARVRAAGPSAAARPRRRLWFGTVAIAALAAAVMVLVVRPRGDETITGKGVHYLRFFVRDGVTGAVAEGAPRQRVHPGDQIRFGFGRAGLAADHAGRQVHVALLGRDAAGKGSIYFPEGAASAAPLPESNDDLLPYSIVLDETLGVETIYALYCPQAVPLGPLQVALTRSEASVVWPPSCKAEQVQLEKTPRQ
jgi:hypothetical protein